jgi:hypothetical protein
MINESNQVIQCLELQKGQINLDSGTIPPGTHIIHGVENGSVTLNWDGGDIDTVDIKANEDYAVRGCSVTINSGKFHIDTI